MCAVSALFLLIACASSSVPTELRKLTVSGFHDSWTDDFFAAKVNGEYMVTEKLFCGSTVWEQVYPWPKTSDDQIVLVKFHHSGWWFSKRVYTKTCTANRGWVRDDGRADYSSPTQVQSWRESSDGEWYPRKEALVAPKGYTFKEMRLEHLYPVSQLFDDQPGESEVSSHRYCNDAGIPQSFTQITREMEVSVGSSYCITTEAGWDLSASASLEWSVGNRWLAEAHAKADISGSTHRNHGSERCDESTQTVKMTLEFPEVTLDEYTSERYVFVQKKAKFRNVEWKGTLTRTWEKHGRQFVVGLNITGTMKGAHYSEVSEHFTDYVTNIESCTPGVDGALPTKPEASSWSSYFYPVAMVIALCCAYECGRCNPRKTNGGDLPSTELTANYS